MVKSDAGTEIFKAAEGAQNVRNVVRNQICCYVALVAMAPVEDTRTSVVEDRPRQIAVDKWVRRLGD